MEQRKSLRLWETAALLALCLCLCAGAWAQGRQNALSASILRLHVLAASDAPEEQALKLRVRDAVLDYLSPRLADAADLAEARARLTQELEAVQRVAASAAEGRQVRVDLGRESYPLRVYGDYSLPAGSYESLRIVLGEGAGQNWWCVVFPPLCLTAPAEDALQSAMGRESFALISGGEDYALRFRTVELWGELCRAWEAWRQGDAWGPEI